MKRFRVMTTIATLVVMLSITVAPVASATQAEGFTGTWASVDVDGSNQILLISQSAAGYNLTWFDDGASICGKDADGKPIYPGIGKGKGYADGYNLPVDIRWWCMSRPPTFWGTFHMDITYDPGTDTLWDGWVLWHRIGNK